ncbi:hypothetical protein DCC85_10620 [Paenibacillus sp. CAA11]|uniref:DUF4179 domain-containing protein n=1 Tax=Paenibacillus sp. CAA11 TaxID=1532905 RepID=UPI000D39C3D1|nr:DUF4179 domain-containing protein [Paenibacillus sp. CAA11]AWB44631.1 hypothetical protein DCC85_10620 [Paenibacillus sp. CAA11]
MLNQLDEKELVQGIKASLEPLAAPESLKAFAHDIASHAQESKRLHAAKRKKKYWRGLAACAAACGILIFTAQVSPAFASMLQNIPGFSVASDWLSTKRGQDGVENAAHHQYKPFEPVMEQFGDIKVSLADVYLTSDKLVYKAFISSSAFEGHIIRNPDGTLGLDREAERFTVLNEDFEQIEGGESQEIIRDKETGESILVSSYTIQLTPEEVQAFIKKNPKILQFKLYIAGVNKQKADREFAVNVPFQSSQWMQDRVIHLNQPVDVTGDPDIQGLVLENVKITPVHTYAELRLDSSQAYELNLDLAKEHVVQLTDNNGKVYPLETYRLKYQPTNVKYEPGRIELSFNSSPYFDETVKSLQLHIADIEVSDVSQGSMFTLDMNEKLPQVVQFKNSKMTITKARYEEGFLKLTVVQDTEAPMQIRFNVPAYMKKIAESPELTKKYYEEDTASRADLLIPEAGRTEYELSIMAPEQSKYEIQMARELDEVQVNRTIDVNLK